MIDGTYGLDRTGQLWMLSHHPYPLRLVLVTKTSHHMTGTHHSVVWYSDRVGVVELLPTWLSEDELVRGMWQRLSR